MYLTQASGMIIGNVAKLLGYMINLIFEGLNAIGIPNVGLAIILFTIAVKLLMMPMTVKQQKFTKINSIMQPEISKVQKKYRGKKDQASMMKQNEEIQAVYAKYGTNATGGCLQLIIQMPIIFALYRVVYNIPAYVDQVKDVYMKIVTPLQGVEGYTDKLIQMKEAAGLTTATISANPNSNQVVDFLYQFKIDTWDKLAEMFSSSPEVVAAIHDNSAKIISMNEFVFGINIAESPGFRISAYLIIPICAALFQFLASKTMQTGPIDDSNPASKMTKNMMTFMPIMSFVMCMTLPAGIGIYWAASSAIQIVQQVAINKYMEHVDMDAMIEKNRIKASKRKKKSFMQRMMAAQNPQASASKSSSTSDGTISNMATLSTKKVQANYETNAGNYEEEETQVEQTKSNKNKNVGSIASKANIMLNYDNKSNNKGGNK